MKTLFRILFIYLPAAYGYYVLFIITLVSLGYLEEDFDANDYKPVYSQTKIIDDRQVTVTYHELK